MMEAMHAGSDDQQAKKAIGGFRNANIPMLEEILDDDGHDMEPYRTGRWSEQSKNYQRQALRKHSFHGMEAEPGGQIEIGLGVMDLVHPPHGGNVMEQPVRDVAGKIEGRKAERKLHAVRQGHSVQRTLRSGPNRQDERNAAKLEGN